jgi:peroxiredoxin
LKISPLILVALLLLFGRGPGFAVEKSPVSIELHDLMDRIQSGLDQGKNTEAELAPQLREFDALLEKYAGEKTDDVAEILATQARLYLQVLDDSAKARQLVLHEDAQRIRSFLVVGTKFPDFSEKDTRRNQLTLSAYQGRVVLVEFWATWSKSSVAEVPQLLAVYDRYRASGFEIIGISLDEDQLRLSGFTASSRMRWPQFCDSGKWKNKLALKYGVNTLPANYLLDAEGKIIAKDLRGSELEDAVAAALAKK